MSKLIVFCSLILMIDGHSYHAGKCPEIDPQPEFNMNRMLGVWYVIQKTSTVSTCILYNFTRMDESGKYLLEQNSQNFILGMAPIKHHYHSYGHLTVPDPSVPGKMIINNPLMVATSANFTVFATDYDNYAGIFSCQKIPFSNRQSATILSRAKTLDQQNTDKLRSKLIAANIDPFDLSIINQNDCPSPDSGVNIGNTAYSVVTSVTGMIDKTKQKIGGGVGFVTGGVKNIYHKVVGSVDDGTEGARKIYHDVADGVRDGTGGVRQIGHDITDSVKNGTETVRQIYHNVADNVEDGTIIPDTDGSLTLPPKPEWLP